MMAVESRRGAAAKLALVLASLLSATTALASQNGRNGFSGNPATNGGATCILCHQPGPALPGVTLSGPTLVNAGETHEYQVLITGGPAGTAGVDISVSGFIGELAPVGTDLHLIGDELSHTVPKGFIANEASFAFLWTAPDYNTNVTLFAAGNSTNNQLDLLGDAVAAQTLAITVQNGTPPPPPPPPTPPGDIEVDAYVTGLDSPVVVTHAGDDRLFVVEQPGRIRLVDGDGNLLPVPFLDIETRVDDSGNEMGLLGLAFHPDYASNGYFYVYYTRDPGPGLDRSRISRFQVSADPALADIDSELVLLEFEQPYGNHNGGDIKFGPDGFLYIASGDGGSGGDPQNFAQNAQVLLGKLLRIDVDNSPGTDDAPDCDISGSANYRIPTSNAFTDGSGGLGCDEIYGLGLRNPWRISFDRLSGDLWIADVGQGSREEINRVLAGTAGGLNFGWRCYEGDSAYNTSGCGGQYFFPLYDFSHADGNCSVTGGFVYRGSANPTLDGHYFFTDFCNNSIRTLSEPQLDPPTITQVLPGGVVNGPSTFGEDVDGELYIASLYAGTVYRIRAADTPPPPPAIIVDNQDNNTERSGDWRVSSASGGWAGQSIYSTGSASFRWLPNFAAPQAHEVFAWWTYHPNRSTIVPYTIVHAGGSRTVEVNQRDPALGSTWVSLGVYNFAGDGSGHVELAMAGGQACADAVRFVPFDGPINQPPQVSIDAPANGAGFTQGDTVTLEGSASDEEDGVLDSAISWSSNIDGELGSGTPLSITGLSPGTHTITATVTDSSGASAEASISLIVDTGGGGIELFFDNLDPGVIQTGNWRISSGPDPWDGQSVYNNGGNTFRWPVAVPTSATYRVYAWWTYHPNRSAAVPYEIGHAGPAATVEVDQSNPALGGSWVLLGTYAFDAGGSHYVEVSSANGQASADAIRLLEFDGPPDTPPAIVVDNQDSNTSRVGRWRTSSAPDPWAGQSLYNDGGGSFRWSPVITEPGNYKVYAWWTYHPNRASNVPYRINHATGTATVIRDQLDPVLAGDWILLGEYSFNADGTGYVEVSSENGQACADAIRLEKQ